MRAAKAQIRARITHVGNEYQKDVTSSTRKLCITDWVARSSPSASSRPSKPASEPPKWLSASTVPTSTTTTGTRSSSSSNPDVSRVTPTKDERSLADVRTIREGRLLLSRKARRASEKTPKINHPNAPTTIRRLLR